jgi:hypothetical protein
MLFKEYSNFILGKMSLKQILAVLSTIGFLAYHLAVDFYYRPNADDFSGMYYASKGFPGLSYAIRFYFEWEGPFLGMIVQGLWMRLLYMGVPGVIILCTIKFMLFASSVYMVEGIIEWVSGKKDWALAVLGGAVITTTMYVISSEQSEIWHWVIGSVAYLHPLLFLQLAIGLLFRGKIYLAILPLAYMMESRATYAVLLFGFITLITIWAWINNLDWKKKALIMDGVLLVFLMIYIFAPGNSKRISQGGFDMEHYIHQYIMEIRNLFLSFNLAKSDRLLMGLMLLVPLAPTLSTEQFQSIKKWIFLPGLAYIAFALAHGVLFVLATGYAAWFRVYAMHTFLFILCALFYGHLAYQMLLDKRLGIWGKWLLPLIGFVLLTASLYRHFPEYLVKGKAYSEAYDARNEKIFSYEGIGSDTLRIESLPDAGVLYYWEFSEDPNHWINKDFRTRYETEFHVALSAEKSVTD